MLHSDSTSMSQRTYLATGALDDCCPRSVFDRLQKRPPSLATEHAERHSKASLVLCLSTALP